MSTMADQELVMAPKRGYWLDSLISLQADLLYNCFVTLSSPFLAFLSLATDSYRRAEETTAGLDTAVQKVPSTITHGGAVLLRRVGLGLLGAAQVGMVLVLAMALAALLGFGLVQLWLEEPVLVKEKLFFDYTEVNPTAEFCLGRGGGEFDGGRGCRKGQVAVPLGHTFHVSLVLLMPESDFNRHIGVFQLSAELLSNGSVTARSSQPVMLRFRSLPIRLARTFVMGIPLLLGISSETQKIKVELLRYKERRPRTEAIRVMLAPRAGTLSLPQLYQVEIIMNSKLPWTKQLVHNWKWTLYVWTSLYFYIMFIIVLLGFFRPIFFPVPTSGFSIRNRRDAAIDESKEPLLGGGDDDESVVSNLMSRWHPSRRKRKAIFLQKDSSDIAGSSASSMTVSREDTSAATIEEDEGDSESVCLGG